MLSDYSESQFKEARETWNTEVQGYEHEIHVLTEQVQNLVTIRDQLSRDMVAKDQRIRLNEQQLQNVQDRLQDVSS